MNGKGDGLRFVLSEELPIPASGCMDGDETVLFLREGAVVDVALVRGLNDLVDADRRHIEFVLRDDLPIPASACVDHGWSVALREGAIVDATLVQILNDLIGARRWDNARNGDASANARAAFSSPPVELECRPRTPLARPVRHPHG